MKKQISFLVLTFIYFSLWSQKAIPTEGPCTNSMVEKAQGRWMKHISFDRGTDNSAEANRRIDEIQNMVLKMYPNPTGVDAVWHRAYGLSYFGAKYNYYTRENRLGFDYSNLPHFSKFYYKCLFFAYHCGEGNSMWPGYPGETGTHLTITANEIQGAVGGAGNGDTWTINGLPVRMRAPVLKTVRGFEQQYPEPGSNARYILIHRKGVLPYIPVTRKQYLDYCIIFHTKIYDDMIKAQEQLPMRTLEEQDNEKKAKLAKFEKDFGSNPKQLKATVDYYLSSYQTDQQRREGQINKVKENKANEIKKFRDELEKSTRENLLDSPAVVLVRYNSSPVFEPDPLRGNMLITENPDYIRKDLPKHVPQVFVVWWRCNDWAPQQEVGRRIEENFPFAKLQEMIDK